MFCATRTEGCHAKWRGLGGCHPGTLVDAWTSILKTKTVEQFNKLLFKGQTSYADGGLHVLYMFIFCSLHPYPANVENRVSSNSIPIYIQQDATLHSLFISGNCSTCFGGYFHPSSGAHTTVSTASGICHTVTAICRYRGRVGTGLSVLRVAYATHRTLKPVPTLPR
jgi:hypothetical protein